jgi:hypothetical protein
MHRGVARSSPMALTAPFTENLEASPTLEVCGVTKMLNDEWIGTLADGRFEELAAATNGYGATTASVVGITTPFLADLAMRGCAISFVMRASIALSDSFLGFLMLPIFTL